MVGEIVYELLGTHKEEVIKKIRVAKKAVAEEEVRARTYEYERPKPPSKDDWTYFIDVLGWSKEDWYGKRDSGFKASDYVGVPGPAGKAK